VRIIPVFLVTCLITSLSYAYEEPISRGKCFIVKNNAPQKIQKCFISAVGGAGGIMRSYEIGNDVYANEIYAGSETTPDIDRVAKNNSKPLDAKTYYRQDKTLKIIKNPRNNDWNCIKDSKSISNFCFKY
jgi:hypothetical protein